jgi:hypothetical protein
MNGFWMGHFMLGDVFGFCAAAHLYSAKIGQPVKVWFEPARREATNYFDGVQWVPREEIPNAIDAGIDPAPEEWPNMNGVKRFYRFMDPSLTPTKSFDIHFNRARRQPTDRTIGLITHSHTQGDIDERTLDQMIHEARRLYPEHCIVSFGLQDNGKILPGIVDRRGLSLHEMVEFIEGLDLLISPQSGPCFIAGGWRVPIWVYRSREAYWDCVLNYDQYKIERWWDRANT